MDIINIEGLYITPLKQIKHVKGDILHCIKKGDPGFVDFGEAYFSSIRRGDIKAWKRHSIMTLNLIVPEGEVKFVLYDDRKGSKTFGAFQELILSKNNYKRLTVPPNIWVGFQGIGSDLNLVLNVADIQHDPNEQENITVEDSIIVYNW
jgi:dTDP-4-dehydrorhamnose 3,5-epimerase